MIAAFGGGLNRKCRVRVLKRLNRVRASAYGPRVGARERASARGEDGKAREGYPGRVGAMEEGCGSDKWLCLMGVGAALLAPGGAVTRRVA